MRTPFLACAALVAFVLQTGLALAYEGPGHQLSIVQGLVHPIGGLDHALAMIAAGILAAVAGGMALWLLPACFVVFMGLGAYMGASRIDLPNYETGIALSVLVFGALIAYGKALPAIFLAVLVAGFALCHGYAHGAEMPLESSALAYAAGFAIATVLLTLIGRAIARGLAGMGGTARIAIEASNWTRDHGPWWGDRWWMVLIRSAGDLDMPGDRCRHGPLLAATARCPLVGCRSSQLQTSSGFDSP